MAEQAITQLESLVSRSDELKAGSETERIRILRLCARLTSQLERPLETLFRTIMSTHSTQICVRVGIDLNLFKVLGPVGGEPIATDIIAAACAHNPDVILVARILRHLGAVSIIREVDHELYGATAISEALITQHFQGAVKYAFDDWAKIPLTVPTFLAATGYRNPENILDTAGTRALGIDTPIYEYFNKMPHMGQHFGGLMQAYNEGRPNFWDLSFYPARERLGGTTNDDDVLLIDIGGGDGNELAQFKAAFPELKGRVILQELAHVVKRMSNKSFEAMEHDWNKPQPIKGARAYLFHHGIHSFSSDEAARNILQNVISAMKPGWSKLLIKDALIPNTGASFVVTGADLGMLQSVAGRDRTEAEWRVLIESAGLRVEAIYTHERSDDGVIECVLD